MRMYTIRERENRMSVQQILRLTKVTYLSVCDLSILFEVVFEVLISGTIF